MQDFGEEEEEEEEKKICPHTNAASVCLSVCVSLSFFLVCVSGGSEWWSGLMGVDSRRWVWEHGQVDRLLRTTSTSAVSYK